MESRIERLARGLLKPMNPYVSALLGLLTLCWGIWCIVPMWHVFNSAPVFAKALEFAPEWAWGTWSAICGVIILSSLYFARARYLALGLGFVTWHWFTVSLMMWWGDWQNTAGLTYAFIAIYGLTAYLNVRVNYVLQHKKHLD